jgi:hypothetical protein
MWTMLRRSAAIAQYGDRVTTLVVALIEPFARHNLATEGFEQPGRCGDDGGFERVRPSRIG